MRTITLTDARKQILTGNPFSMTFCTYDEKRNTGGERVQVSNCRMMRNEEDKREVAAPAMREDRDFKSGRNPRHLLHNSFNVVLANGKPQKVHWLLMEEFNGFKIIL